MKRKKRKEAVSKLGFVWAPYIPLIKIQPMSTPSVNITVPFFTFKLERLKKASKRKFR